MQFTLLSTDLTIINQHRMSQYKSKEFLPSDTDTSDDEKQKVKGLKLVTGLVGRTKSQKTFGQLTPTPVFN